MDSGITPAHAGERTHFSICSGLVCADSNKADDGVSARRSSNGLSIEPLSEPRRYKSASTESQQTVTSSAADCSINGFEGIINANKKQLNMSSACLCILSPYCWLHNQRITSTLVCEDMNGFFFQRALSKRVPSSFSNKPIRASPTSP